MTFLLTSSLQIYSFFFLPGHDLFSPTPEVLPGIDSDRGTARKTPG